MEKLGSLARRPQAFSGESGDEGEAECLKEQPEPRELRKAQREEEGRIYVGEGSVEDCNGREADGLN